MALSLILRTRAPNYRILGEKFWAFLITEQLTTDVDPLELGAGGGVINSPSANELRGNFERPL